MSRKETAGFRFYVQTFGEWYELYDFSTRKCEEYDAPDAGKPS